MERLFKAVKVASIIMLITIVIITIIVYCSVKKEIQFINREKAMLDYYEGYFDDSPSYASSQIKILEEI